MVEISRWSLECAIHVTNCTVLATLLYFTSIRCCAHIYQELSMLSTLPVWLPLVLLYYH